MEVELLTHTPDPLNLIYTAARTCYSKDTPQDIWATTEPTGMDIYAYTKMIFEVLDREAMLFGDQVDDAEKRKRMAKLFKSLYLSGHHSTFEHVSFTFAISGITRQTTHQLVRHRHASFSQQSLRYVEARDAEFDLPDHYFTGDIPDRDGYDGTLGEYILFGYDHMLNDGIKKEDARRILPIGTKTNIVVTMNLRSILHFCSLRKCTLSQKEIRILANKMAKIVTVVEPLFKPLIKCQTLGYCPEDRNKDNHCRVKPHHSQIVNLNINMPWNY